MLAPTREGVFGIYMYLQIVYPQFSNYTFDVISHFPPKLVVVYNLYTTIVVNISRDRLFKSRIVLRPVAMHTMSKRVVFQFKVNLIRIFITARYVEDDTSDLKRFELNSC